MQNYSFIYTIKYSKSVYYKIIYLVVPRPISIDKSALKQMKNKEAEILKSQTYITNHLYKRLIQKGFVLPSPSRTKLKTKPACFIYDTLMFLGYFSNDYSIMNNKYRINKAKRDRIKEIIIFTK